MSTISVHRPFGPQGCNAARAGGGEQHRQCEFQRRRAQAQLGPAPYTPLEVRQSAIASGGVAAQTHAFASLGRAVL